MLQKNNNKIIKAWCMYDWANSVYALTITTAIFPSYFYGVTGGKDALADFFGLKVSNTVLYSYTLTAAFLLVAFLNPLLSGIADYGGKKKRFMQFFCYLGSLSCIALYFFDSSNIELGVIAFGMAGVGFAGSLVFYNSFLPEIATPDQFDKISAKGFSLGYIGSVLLLVVNLAMILKPDFFGIPTDSVGKALDGTLAPRISFLMVGLWWAGFAQVTFSKIPNNVYDKKEMPNLFTKGFQELKKVWYQLADLPETKKFLLAFGLYSLGVQTIMYLATIFGEEVVFSDISPDERQGKLIFLVLIIQLIAIPGSFLFSKLSEWRGNVFSLSVSLIIWIGICVGGYLLDTGMHTQYYILGCVVGLVMGGVQSMSRSTYSKLIPANTQDHASYFSFYETLEKSSIALGTLVYGVVMQLTGKMNNSALVLTVFFVAGFWVLTKMKKIKI